jgi:UDP:flavonoid glycosyltransferase YjiC (YdhE family)
MAKIILAAPPIPGELRPLLAIGRALTARGHQITVLTGAALEDTVRKAGLTFAAMTGDADYDTAELGSRPASRAAGPGHIDHDWEHAFARPMPEEHRALQGLLEADPDQHLIANVLFLGAWPTRLGAPGRRPRRWIAVSVVGFAYPSVDTTYFGPVPVFPGQDQRAANVAANARFVASMRPNEEVLYRLLRELGATDEFPTLVEGTVELPDATALLSVPGYEFHRSDLPADVHFVGTVPIREMEALGIPEWEPPSWWAELDGSRPVVVVTQGTLANFDLSHLVEPALAGLADLDVTVVAALGRDPSALAGPVPGNARVEAFIPFSELLPRADVLITNGGANSVHQSLAAGVPVIVAGATEEKPANAARVAHHRLGIDLRTGTPTAQAVRLAVERVLGNPAIRANVKRLAAVYPTYDTFAEVERLVLG